LRKCGITATGSSALRKLTAKGRLYPDAITARHLIEYNEELYKVRVAVERVFGKLKENRRLALRYEKSDLSFLGFVLFGFLKMPFANSA